jgi:hypothetical protein
MIDTQNINNPNAADIQLNEIYITLDNNSFNKYESNIIDQLTIKVKPDVDFEVNLDEDIQIVKYTFLNIKSSSIKTLNISFFKSDGSTQLNQDGSNGNEILSIKFGPTISQTLFITLNQDGKYVVNLLSGNEFNNVGIEEIKDKILKDPTNIASRAYVDDQISKIPGLDSLTGSDADGIPNIAVKRSFTIRPSGWLCYSLGVIDNEVSSNKPVAVYLNIELNSNSLNSEGKEVTTFNDEFIVYPYKSGTTIEDTTKVPSTWSLLQPKSGLGVMPLIPGDNQFTDYSVAGKPVDKGFLVKNNTDEYLIGGRFNGSNSIQTTPIKDKMSFHSQGSMLLHVVFSVVDPRTIYFKINNPYAPFIKILFYSFQIQSFYNCVLKYFYSPVYKNVVFQEKSFDAKGLFINTAPIGGSINSCPIQNIYQWSKIDLISKLFNKFDDKGIMYSDMNDDDFEGFTLGVKRAGEAFIGPKDCDFRYFAGDSIFPSSGTNPLLKSADQEFFQTPSDKLIIANNLHNPAFIKIEKRTRINNPTVGMTAEFVENDSVFEVIDKGVLNITSVVDMNFGAVVTTSLPIRNVERIALTINSNIIYVIDAVFMQKIIDGKFKVFDLIFNQKQCWFTIVFKKNALLNLKDRSVLLNLFPQFGSSTTASQKIIAEEINKINIGANAQDVQMTFRFFIKAKLVSSKTILDSVDKVIAIKPTTLLEIKNGSQVISREFEVKNLDDNLKQSLKNIGVKFD